MSIWRQRPAWKVCGRDSKPLRADFHSILREVRAENNRRFDQINQRIDRLFWAIITIGGGLLAIAVAALVRDLL